MNRREFFQVAALLAAGATTLPADWVLSAEQKRLFRDRQDFVQRSNPDFFTPAQRDILAALVDIIIPRTDTPGALDAGVPKFIELIVGGWFNEGERAGFMTGLESFMTGAGRGFTTMTNSRQLQLLEALESASGDAPWYKPMNVTPLGDIATPFICQIKELTALGFFLSPVGSRQVLRTNPMGVFRGDIPLKDTDSAYAAIYVTR